MADYYKLDAEEVFRLLGSSKNGLSGRAAAEKLGEFGSNALPEKKKHSFFWLFAEQFRNFLVIILVLAAIVSFFVGDMLDALVILAIVFLNAVFGAVQEFKAEESMEALRKMTALRAVVVRDGKEQNIDAMEIVPGDVIILDAGFKVPADARLFECQSLKTDEASLTGESVPVEKSLSAIKKSLGLAEQSNMVFMNTVVVYGRAKAVVVATGLQTEVGKIASLIGEIEEPETPLMRNIKASGKLIGIGILAICCLIFLIDVSQGASLFETLLVALSLAVAAIPEGLPAIITITLALGMRKMAGEKAIVRKLEAIESIGAATVICSDKTGTLTKNEMVVRELCTEKGTARVTGNGFEAMGDFVFGSAKIDAASDKDFSMLLAAGALCNNARLVEGAAPIGDSTEIALLVAAAKARISRKGLEAEYSFVKELPFDSDRKMMSSVFSKKARLFVFSKGSAESVLKKSPFVFAGGKRKELSEAGRKAWLEKNNEMARRGLRVLGIAFKEASGEKDAAEKNLAFVGLVGMIDAPRPESRAAIEICKRAGIEVKMITGDHKLTAVAVAKELGLAESEADAISGEELDELSTEELARTVVGKRVFARISPKHKFLIVEALQRKGEIVVVTGDGVNDAPALKKAEVGVAMGITGTDVAKEASNIIVTDDNFATIVSAVREGRRMFANINNAIRYLLSANLAEILVVLAAALARLPLPLAAIQLLWLNLVTDGLPALALGVEPAEKNIMEKKPRNPRENIVKGMIPFIVITGVAAAAVSLAAFLIGLLASAEKGMTMAFSTLVFFELFLVFNCRSESLAFFEKPLLENKKLVYGVAVSALMQLAVIFIPFLNPLFKTVWLGTRDFAVVVLLAVTGLFVPIIEKRIFKR